MIILSSTSDSLKVVLGATVTTNQLKCYSAYNDTTTTSITPGRRVATTNNTTSVDIVQSPASSTQRIVGYLSVYNTDTVSSTVTINLVSSSTTYPIFVTTLSTGEKLEYQQGEGFRVLAADGTLKIVTNPQGIPTSSAIQYVHLTGDVSTTSTTLVDITGLGFPVTAGKTYWFRFTIAGIAPNTATGFGWTINGPSTTFLNYQSIYPSSSTTMSYNNGLSTYDNPSTAVGNSPGAGGTIIFIEGLITPSANGTVIGRFRSEAITGTITAKAGSVVFYQQLN
jgi:hypothetical protein